MAQVMVSPNEEVTHLRGDGVSLCGEQIKGVVIEQGELTCPKCARMALTAISLSTKTERKEWRKL